MKCLGPALWICGALLTLVASAGAADGYVDDFEQQRLTWRFDSQWSVTAGELRATGLPGKVLAVGCEEPTVSDFRARLTLWQRGAARSENRGLGLVYRFDAERRDGCFVAVGANHGYGFGRVQDGAFKLLLQGRSALLDLAAPGEISLEVVGDRHLLRYGGQFLDVWRDPPRRGGGMGLLVIDDVDAGFDDFRVESLDEGGPPPLFGPVGAPSETPSGLGAADLELANRWRHHYNRAAAARGQATLPEPLDVVDLAVLALLKQANLWGEVPPAIFLATWLTAPELVARGAVGPAPVAALAFWLQYRGTSPGAEELGSTEDLLAALRWYEEVRAAGEANGGSRTAGPLAMDERTADRIEADRRRWVESVTEADRAARQQEINALLQDLLRLAARARATGLTGAESMV